MTLTNLQRVRLRIQDQPRIADTTYYGDGSASVFQLPHRNLVSGSAYVPGGAGWTATGGAFDASGFVSFSGVISANSAWRARYTYSNFSDTEIDDWISAYGSVNGAAIEAVTTLMFDGLRRAAWASPDGTEYDDTKAMTLLNDLYKVLKDEEADEAAVGGSVESWSLEQGNW